MTKRFISLFLCAMMVLTLVPLSVFANGTEMTETDAPETDVTETDVPADGAPEEDTTEPGSADISAEKEGSLPSQNDVVYVAKVGDTQ